MYFKGIKIKVCLTVKYFTYLTKIQAGQYVDKTLKNVHTL